MAMMKKKGDRLVFAYYVTGHGFGHATRVVEVVRHLIVAGHDVHVVTAAPDFVFTSEIQSPRLFIRKVLLDCGAVQADALTVDPLASLEMYSKTAVLPRASILATEVEWLKSIEADLVVSDVVPVVCQAAANAGISSVCVSNFSWDFIYAEYVMAAGYDHRSIVWQIAQDYSHCKFLIRLPGYCPMPAFRDVIDVPLVVRRLHKSRAEPAGWNLKKEYLPAGWLCLVCGASENQELPPNFRKLAKDAYTPDVIAASDCMLGKIGYGTFSEALAYKLPFVFVRRDYFNEEPFLRNMLEYYQGGIEMIRRDFLTGRWIPYLERAISLKPCYQGGSNGGEVAACILQDTAVGKHYASDKFSGARRLQDAIVLGYQLQRAVGKDICIPYWYSLAANELSLHTALPTIETTKTTSITEVCTEDFEILHGDIHGLSDTASFLKSLARLDASYDSGKNTKCQMRERVAAAALFNWEEEIFVARAPGRLDVMGGIADYSGSLVLQMPIREACHVAVQKNDPSKQKLWKHVQARQHIDGQGPKPILQIVSFGSELSNRGPTFDMDLSDFLQGEQPISYKKAKEYFARDPAQKWAAYVAGTILVLMRELGVRFENSISIVVSSAVPEGKGVSSSAAVEVASMSAIAASHGLNIAPRDLALLCQKVENHIVGAPCGVMDQMASVCGEANKLLAMVCQPAEVLGLVEIPSHIQFWGIDSGIRHSVGGADYGSVRIGTFLGRKMIKSMASEISSYSLANGNSDWQVCAMNSDEMEKDGRELLEVEASLDYLCNLSPHRYEAVFAKKLPEYITGEAFMEKYVDHEDSVTVIDQKRNYAVRASTRHPIYENFRVKCHYSYSACGLGSDGTDRLVKLVQEMQHSKSYRSGNGSLYGAKITGGGSGGTVCVIGSNCLRSSQQILEIYLQGGQLGKLGNVTDSIIMRIQLWRMDNLMLQIQQRYKDATGFMPFIFEGSSPGAAKFGYLKIRRRSPANPI
ncbi:hypothetical protein AAG906_003207 [Vitis piasezkii]